MPEFIVTTPGLYDLAPAVYHGDPIPGGSLSQSRAKTLLREAGPARFRHYEAIPETKPEWDLGTAAHSVVLGKGSERLALIDSKDYRNKPAQTARDAAYAKGMTPVLPHQMRQVEAMAEELSRHKLATETLAGKTEVAMFYRRDDGLWLRSQMDAMNPECTGDYKTSADASSWFARSAWKYRYPLQGAWYRRLRAWLTGDWLPYRLVAQETTAPYLVSVWELDPLAIRQGESDMDEAIATYQRCMESGQWPGYPDEIQTLSPPDWALDDEIEID